MQAPATSQETYFLPFSVPRILDVNFPALLFLVSSSAGPSPLRGDTELLLCPEDLPEATAASLGACSPRRLSARLAPPRRAAGGQCVQPSGPCVPRLTKWKMAEPLSLSGVSGARPHAAGQAAPDPHAGLAQGCRGPRHGLHGASGHRRQYFPECLSSHLSGSCGPRYWPGGGCTRPRDPFLACCRLHAVAWALTAT